MFLVVGLLFGNGTICFGSILDWFNAPPRYTAQAEFSVNWNQVPAKDQDSNPQKARREFKNRLANFKVSKQFVSILCERCNIPSTQSASITADLGRYLNITPAGMTNHANLYRIQYSDTNSDVALKAVNLLCNRLVNGINRQAKATSVDKALKSYQDNAENRDKEEKLRNEMADLMQRQGQEYSAEKQKRIEEIKEELNQNDLDKMVSGLGLLVNGVSILANPAKIEKAGWVREGD